MAFSGGSAWPGLETFILEDSRKTYVSGVDSCGHFAAPPEEVISLLNCQPSSFTKKNGELVKL
jgi:hypothetical protein